MVAQENERIANGAVVRALRALHGMTQPELSQRLGISRQTLASIEHGKHRLAGTSESYILKICNALGVEVAQWEQVRAIFESSSRRITR